MLSDVQRCLLRRAGLGPLVAILTRRLWSTRCWLGLRCDLAALPEVPPARIPIRMVPARCPGFDGFTEELARVTGWAAVEVAERAMMCAAGVPTLYVGTTDEGAPIYAQWLTLPHELPILDAFVPHAFAVLEPDTALVENAYTFLAFRGQRAMADGMRQLLCAAREQGARSVVTYVLADNVPSLRGCAAVGFTLDHLRWMTRRFGRREVRRVPPAEHDWQQWQAAVAPSGIR